MMMRRTASPDDRLIRVLLALLVLGSLQIGLSFGAEPADDSPEQLVEQLGAPVFKLREAAQAKLIAMGVKAKQAVEAGCRHADAEIQFRCQYIRNSIAHQEFLTRIEDFVADADGKNGVTLPGWDRFSKLAGADQGARELYAEMYRYNSGFLEQVDESPQDASDSCTQLGKDLQRSLRQPSTPRFNASIASLLFVAADDRVNLTQQTCVSLYSLTMQTGFQEILKSDEKKYFRPLLSEFVSRSNDGSSAYYQLRVAMRYDLKAGVTTAQRILKDGPASQHYKMYAILTIGKLGSRENIADLEPLLTDDSVCSSTITKTGDKSVRYITQVRDVALAVSIYLHGEDPKEFGFSRITKSPQYLYSPSTMGFNKEKPELRDAATKQWKEFLAKQEKEEK
jgi:hypothetical protein